MRVLFIIILSLSCSLVFAQQDTLGFTNKAEAKNLMINGKKEGKWLEYIGLDERSIVKKTNSYYYRLAIYKKGSIIGIARLYDDSIPLKLEMPYRNGKVNGVVKKYSDHAILSKCLYVDDRRNGVDTTYWHDGKLMGESPYVNDTLNGVVRENDSFGNIYSETPYINGQIDGTRNDYYGNGVLKSATTYNKGLKNGIEKHYYESGKLKYEIVYLNDKESDINFFHENGYQMSIPASFKSTWDWHIFNCIDSSKITSLDTLKISSVIHHYLNISSELCFNIDGDRFQFYYTRTDTLPYENGGIIVIKTDKLLKEAKWAYDPSTNILKLTLSDKPNGVVNYLVKESDSKDVFLIKQPLNNEIKK